MFAQNSLEFLRGPVVLHVVEVIEGDLDLGIVVNPVLSRLCRLGMNHHRRASSQKKETHKRLHLQVGNYRWPAV